MSNLFIKREVKVDGMPKSKGKYWVVKQYTPDHTTDSQSYFDGKMFGSEYVTHYLEPASLPTEEEIEKAAEFHAICNDSNLYEGNKMGFRGAIDWLLSHLTNTNQS